MARTGGIAVASFLFFTAACGAAGSTQPGFDETDAGGTGNTKAKDAATDVANGFGQVDAGIACSTDTDCPRGSICQKSTSGGDIASAECVVQSYTVGGSVTGLTAGDSLVLEDNGADDLTVSANGAFTFKTPVVSTYPYAVTVSTQPTTPSAETCTVTMGSGTMMNAAITNVVVTCNPPSFSCICPFNQPQASLSMGCTGLVAYSGAVPGNVCSINQGSKETCPTNLNGTACYLMDHVSYGTGNSACSPAVGDLTDTGTGIFLQGKWSCTPNP